MNGEEQKKNIKDIRKAADLTQREFAETYGIPIGTLQHWEAGERKPPEYVLQLLWRVVQADTEEKKKALEKDS